MSAYSNRGLRRAGCCIALLLTGFILAALPAHAERTTRRSTRTRSTTATETAAVRPSASRPTTTRTTASRTDTTRRLTPAPAVDTRPAIRVNRTLMSQDDFDRHVTVEFRRMLMSRQIPAESVPIDAELSIRREMVPQVTQRLLSRMILLDAAKQAGVVISADEAESRWQAFRYRFPTDTILRQAIEEQGSTVEAVRGELMTEMLIDRYLRGVITDTEVTPREARAFYDTNPEEFVVPELVHARHILLPPDTASLVRIRELKAEIDGGADFAEVAKRNSIDGSAENGGDLGEFPREQMVAPFADAAFACPVGQVTGPVQTEFGWHLIKVEGHKAAGKISFDEVKDRLIQALSRKKTQEAVQALLTRLREADDIEVHTGAEQTDPMINPAIRPTLDR